MEPLLGWFGGGAGLTGLLWGLWKIGGHLRGSVLPVLRAVAREFIESDPKAGNGTMREALTRVERTTERVDSRLERVEGKVDGLDGRVDGLEARLTKHLAESVVPGGG